MRDAATGDQENIGTRLNGLRVAHGYSIRGLAQKAGVSASQVSDIEKGKVEPSITTLKRLAEAMGTTITYFFSEHRPANGRVVRAAERVVVNGGKSVPSGIQSRGVRFSMASPEEAETIEAIYGHYEVGASLGEETYTHAGEEWGMVLRGRLKVVVGDEIHFLETGDSIWFPSTLPHRMENVASEATEYIWINTPKSF